MGFRGRTGATDEEQADLLHGRILAVLAALEDRGELEKVCGESAAEQSDVRYRRVPPPPVCGYPRQRGRRGRAAEPSRAERMEEPLVDLRVMKPENEDVQTQSWLETQFAKFFKGIVSEWNPCFTEDGQLRYRWDEELGEHDMEVDRASLEGTSEGQARLEVDVRAPDRINLRSLLDGVFTAGDEAACLDVQRVRRLVALLVNRVARHTKHGVQAPKLGVHACARGKETCPKCRYGFLEIGCVEEVRGA